MTLFLAFHFWETTVTFLGSTKMEIQLGKHQNHTGKNSGKVPLSPLKNVPVTPLHILNYMCHLMKIAQMLYNKDSNIVCVLSTKDSKRYLCFKDIANAPSIKYNKCVFY